MRALVITLVLAGCASAPPEATSPADLDEGALASWVAGEGASGASLVVRRDAPLRAPVRIARREAPSVPAGRPITWVAPLRDGIPTPANGAGVGLPSLRFAPTIDVRFERAPLASALGLLAEEANLGLVVGEGVEGSVSASLSRVRPVDVMQALADAHGVELTFVGRTVIARGR